MCPKSALTQSRLACLAGGQFRYNVKRSPASAGVARKERATSPAFWARCGLRLFSLSVTVLRANGSVCGCSAFQPSSFTLPPRERNFSARPPYEPRGRPGAAWERAQNKGRGLKKTGADHGAPSSENFSRFCSGSSLCLRHFSGYGHEPARPGLKARRCAWASLGRPARASLILCPACRLSGYGPAAHSWTFFT